MANVSHKLRNAFEGALAGGGDPATSPLYVFGPFLKTIIVAGVAQVTFGGSIWLVILTIAAASAVYRFVMRWITLAISSPSIEACRMSSFSVTREPLRVFRLSFIVWG